MIINTSAANAVDMTEKMARYDNEAKHILAQKIYTATLLKECVREFQSYSIEEVIASIDGNIEVGTKPVHPNTPELTSDKTENSILGEGKVNFDLKMHAKLKDKDYGIIINIEVENDKKKYSILKRAEYYLARLLSTEYGTIFTGSDYQDLEKVYSIWIYFKPDDENKKNAIYTIFPESHILYGNPRLQKSSYDLMEAVIIEIANEEELTDNRLLSFVTTLFSVKMGKEKKKYILEKDFNIQMKEESKEIVEDMCNLSSYAKAIGRDEGRKEGKLSALTESVKSLMENTKCSMEKAFDMLNISPQDRVSITQNIRK